MKKRVTIVTLALLMIAAALVPASAQTIQSEADAKAIVQAHLTMNRNPNLQVGPARDVGRAYEVEVLTLKGTLVDRILVEKGTGQLRSLYGAMLLSTRGVVGGRGPAAAGEK